MREWTTTKGSVQFWVIVTSNRVEFGEQDTRSPHYPGGVKNVPIKDFLNDIWSQRTIVGNLGQAVLDEVLEEVRRRLDES